MSNFITRNRRWKLTTAILSLSLLTVMAGAAVAPALNLIRDYFADANTGLVQMIISLPALFIALTSFLFRPLCKRFRARTLMLIGLILYTVGGCLAGAFSSIFLVLVFRAVVGIGVGIIMPLSTGLISFYFTKDKQAPLMGMSSAMNMMGGVVATTIMPWLSAALYAAQFTTPMILTAIRGITGMPDLSGYLAAIGSSILLLLCSIRAKG